MEFESQRLVLDVLLTGRALVALRIAKTDERMPIDKIGS